MPDAPLDTAPLRALLTLTPPLGAQERVLHALLAAKPATPHRRVRPLLLVLAMFATTTAAAFGVTLAPHWLVRHLGLMQAPVLVGQPRPTAPRKSNAPRPSPQTPVPGPDLPLLPPPPPDAPAPSLPKPGPNSGFGTETRGARPHAEDPTTLSRESLLAQQAAAYREAVSLVETSPGLAVVRLRAFRERWPDSPLGEEAHVRLVQALLALGRDADARVHAQSFLSRYPGSAKRADMAALLAGTDAPARGE